MRFLEDWTPEQFEGKTILDIGTGSGSTILELMPLMEKTQNTTIISIDIVEIPAEIQEEFIFNNPIFKDRLTFRCIDAADLTPIPTASIDIIISQYSLCAINQYAGKLGSALTHFQRVLKPMGIMFIEEEFPLSAFEQLNKDKVAELKGWQQYWTFLKMLIQASYETPFHEIDPDHLESLLKHLGFDAIQWEQEFNILGEEEALYYLDARCTEYFSKIHNLPTNILQDGLEEFRDFVHELIEEQGSLPIPIYVLQALKKSP